MMAQNWVMMISELHRYQGVSYKSDIIVLSGDIIVLCPHCSALSSYRQLQDWTRETDRLWSRNILAVTLPACWTARMEGNTHDHDLSPTLNDINHGLRFVLKGTSYNPMDVANCLMIRYYN